MSKTWFVTGASRGLGRRFVEAALSRGDKVAATARGAAALTDLMTSHRDAVLPLELDVTDKAAVFAGVQQAKEHFGRLDVIVNNAGYDLFGEPRRRAVLRAENTPFPEVGVPPAFLGRTPFQLEQLLLVPAARGAQLLGTSGGTSRRRSAPSRRTTRPPPSTGPPSSAIWQPARA